MLNHRKIKLIAYDFDGVMTDNTAFIFQDGKEAVKINRSDGLAISFIKKAGIGQIIISTETNPVVTARADKLKIKAIQSCSDKKEAIVLYCRDNNIDLRDVIYVGNDINDLEVMKIVGYPVCPSDAYKEIVDVSTFITNSKGGEGVIRDLIDYLFDENNKKTTWDKK